MTMTTERDQRASWGVVPHPATSPLPQRGSSGPSQVSRGVGCGVPTGEEERPALAAYGGKHGPTDRGGGETGEVLLLSPSFPGSGKASH